MQRRARVVEPGLIQIDQVLKASGKVSGTDVTGPYWMLGFVQIQKGEFAFKQGDRKIEAPARDFAMFLPPFSIVQVELRDAVTVNSGFASQLGLPRNCPAQAIAFPWDGLLPKSLKDVVKSIESAKKGLPIARCLEPHALSLRVKQSLEKAYYEKQTMNEIASLLKTSPAVVSRYFRKDFGLTPVQYRHWLRVMDAMVRIIEGTKVVTAGYDVGFQSMSQFYEQFAKIAEAPPARYQRKKSKNRKS